MKVAGFEFREGHRFQSGAVANANAIGEHLELLRKKCKGEITPKDVVDDARHNNSPLHSFFEWNDSKAAEQHRLSQARGLIRSVVAIYTEPDKPARRVNAFVHVSEGETSHYRATHHAMSQKDTREAVLRQAFRELRAWQRRYQDLDEFAALFEEVERVAKKLPDE